MNAKITKFIIQDILKSFVIALFFTFVKIFHLIFGGYLAGTYSDAYTVDEIYEMRELLSLIFFTAFIMFFLFFFVGSLGKYKKR